MLYAKCEYALPIVMRMVSAYADTHHENQYHRRQLLRLPTQSQTYARTHSLTDALTLSLSLAHTHTHMLSITSQHCFWY
jgi:hypothetical protein